MVRPIRFRIFLFLEEEKTLLDIAKSKVVKKQRNASHVEVCNIVRNHANSEMPRVITVSGKVIFVRCVKPYPRRGCTPIHYLYWYVPPNGVVILEGGIYFRGVF